VLAPFPVVVAPRLSAARAFGPDSVELTPSVRLPSRVPIRIDLRYYDCEGEPVGGLQEEGYEILVFFMTGDFADWEVVEGPGNQVEILVHRNPGARGQIAFGIRKWGELPFQPFGPFPVTIY